MKTYGTVVACCVLAASAAIGGSTSRRSDAAERSPKIVYILADDKY